MTYTTLEKKFRMINEKDFEFVAQFLDLVVLNYKNTSLDQEPKNPYLKMLDESFAQLENGEVDVKSIEELRVMES